MRPACRRLALAWLTFAFAEAADGAQELHTSRRGSPGMAATDAVDGAVAKLTTTTTSNPKRVSRGRLRSLLQLSFIAPPPGTPLIPGECLSRCSCIHYWTVASRPLALQWCYGFSEVGAFGEGLVSRPAVEFAAPTCSAVLTNRSATSAVLPTTATPSCSG
jgi:hypothetical protein